MTTTTGDLLAEITEKDLEIATLQRDLRRAREEIGAISMRVRGLENELKIARQVSLDAHNQYFDACELNLELIQINCQLACRLHPAAVQKQ